MGDVPLMTYILSCPMLLMPCCWCYQVDAMSEAAILHFGVLTGMQAEPGLHCGLPGGRETIAVSMKLRSVNLPATKVLDRSGSPLVVSAILNYCVSNAQRAALGVDGLDHYASVTALGVLKQSVVRYTYDQLKNNQYGVNAMMQQQLGRLLQPVGLRVGAMSLNELSYAPEIAAVMLKKQQAGAMLEAKNVLIDGAVQVCQGAVARLQQGGLRMTDDAKCALIGKLLTVTCSDAAATPTVPLA